MISRWGTLLSAAGLVATMGACSAVVGQPTTSSSPAPSSTASAPAKSKTELLGDELRAGPPQDVQAIPASDGLPPVVSSVPTTDKVVFITIDDGASKDPGVANLLRATGLPVTPFLTANIIRDNPKYFGKISKLNGQTIQNHSMTHPQMKTLSESGQQEQICGTTADLQKWFGAKPWMFRPPYGEYNDETKAAAKACGIDYLVLWGVSLPSDLLRYAEGDKLEPGDIILTHWRDDLALDLLRTFRDIRDQGFKVAALQDYLPKRG